MRLTLGLVLPFGIVVGPPHTDRTNADPLWQQRSGDHDFAESSCSTWSLWHQRRGDHDVVQLICCFKHPKVDNRAEACAGL